VNTLGVEVEIEKVGPLLKIRVHRQDKESVALGPAADYPNVVGLLVAQMAREGYAPEEICEAVKKVLNSLSSSR